MQANYTHTHTHAHTHTMRTFLRKFERVELLNARLHCLGQGTGFLTFLRTLTTTYEVALLSLKACSLSSRSVSVLQFQRLFGRPFVKRFALCYRTRCLSVCLSVTLVYCGRTVGWIKIKLGMGVGLGPGDIVLDGDPAALPKEAQPLNFWPISVVAKRLYG